MHLAKDKFDRVRVRNLYDFYFNNLFQDKITSIEMKNILN